jgi:alanine racemase
VAERRTFLGVLPIGYGDGWRRALSGNADVLIAQQRRPIVGTVSMDNLTVELGDSPDALALRGSEAVLIGARGEQRITAEEVARRMDTINYEVTCALTGRVPRVYHRDGEPVSVPAGESASEPVGGSQTPRASVRPR